MRSVRQPGRAHGASPAPEWRGRGEGGSSSGAFLEVHDFRLPVERPVRSPGAPARRRPPGKCYGCAYRRSTCMCARPTLTTASLSPDRLLATTGSWQARACVSIRRRYPIVELVPGGAIFNAVPCSSSKCSRWTATAGGDEVSLDTGHLCSVTSAISPHEARRPGERDRAAGPSRAIPSPGPRDRAAKDSARSRSDDAGIEPRHPPAVDRRSAHSPVPGRLNGVMIHFELERAPGIRLSTHPDRADRRCSRAHLGWVLPEPLPQKPGARYRLTWRRGIAGQPGGVSVAPASPGGEGAAPGR